MRQRLLILGGTIFLAIGGTRGSSLWQVLGWTAGIVLVFVPLCVRKYRRLQ